MILNAKDIHMLDCFVRKLISTTGRVPESVSCLYSNSTDKGIRCIIETLISSGDLIEACNVGEKFLLSQCKQGKLIASKYTIPYNSFDRLLMACSMICQQGNATVTACKRHNIDLIELKSSMKRLEKALESYFIILHGIDELSVY